MEIIRVLEELKYVKQLEQCLEHSKHKLFVLVHVCIFCVCPLGPFCQVPTIREWTKISIESSVISSY